MIVARNTFGDGTTENVVIIRSGYSSRIFDIKRVPIPEPVPPPSEWVIWNPLKQMQMFISRLKIRSSLKQLASLFLEATTYSTWCMYKSITESINNFLNTEILLTIV